ncbi:MAG: putative Zn-dependent peptidase [Candidatus Krumholzibacteriia bacterium]
MPCSILYVTILFRLLVHVFNAEHQGGKLINSRILISVCTLVSTLICVTTSLANAETFTTTLPNGMQVRVIQDSDESLVRVGMYFAAGRANDPDSLAGLAHLAEHLMTESSIGYPDRQLQQMTNLYSTYSNAYTSNGYMQFDTQCLPEFLPRVLEFEVERMRGPNISEVTFQRERAVVQEEIAMSLRRTPNSEHLEQLRQACYKGHPFGELIGGDNSSIARMTLDDFDAFHRRNILPRRAALVIRGPGDAQGTLALVDSLFAFGPDAQPEPLSVPAFPPSSPGQIVGDALEFTGVKVSVACRVPLKDVQTTALVTSLYYFLDPTRFGFNLRSVPGEAIVFLSLHFDYYKPPPVEDQKYGYIYDDFDSNQDAQNALGRIWRGLGEEMGELAKPKVFEARREKALLFTGDFRGNHGVAMVNGNSALTKAEVDSVLTNLTFEQVDNFVAEYLATARAVVGVTHGSDSERQQAIELAERAAERTSMAGQGNHAELTADQIAPVMAAYGRANLQPIDRLTLSNAVPFYYIQVPGESRIKLGGNRMIAPLKVQRPGDKPGLTHIYGLLVYYDDRQRRLPDDVDFRPRQLPFQLGLSLSPGLFHYKVDGSGTKVSRMAKSLARRLESSQFNQERWNQVSRSGHSYLSDISNYATNIAAEWRMRQVLGDKYYDLGYWAPDSDTLDKIKYKDLVKLHERVAGKTGQTVLFGSGSLLASEVLVELDKTLGQRKSFEHYDGDRPEPALVSGITGKVVPDLSRGDVVLSVVFPVADLGISRSLVTELLLEALVRKGLMSRLRNAEGLTYNVGVNRSSQSGQVVWQVHVTCRRGQAHLVLEILREELRKFVGEGFVADDFARAQLTLTGRLIRSFSDADEGYQLLNSLTRFGPLPTNLLRRVAEARLSEVNELCRSAFSADRFAFTATGPMFEEDLEVFGVE